MARPVVQTAKVDWDLIHSRTYFASDDCWTGCGSFCCTHELEDFQFQIIQTGGSNIVYLGQELDFLADRNGLGREDVLTHELALEFGGTRALKLYQRHCGFRGLCAGCMEKPLHCRLYPFVPEFSPEGELKRLQDASIFDVTFSALGWKSPCTVKSDRAAALKLCQADPDWLAPLRHPYLMFHFASYGVIVDSYTRCLGRETSLSGLTGGAFWRAWELLYLTGKLFEWDYIRSELRSLEAAYLEIYGEFR